MLWALETTAIPSAQFGFDSPGPRATHAPRRSHLASQERKLGWDEKPLQAPSLPSAAAADSRAMPTGLPPIALKVRRLSRLPPTPPPPGQPRWRPERRASERWVFRFTGSTKKSRRSKSKAGWAELFNRQKPKARNTPRLSLATAVGEKRPKVTEVEFDHLKAGKQIRNLGTVKGSSLSPLYKQETNLGA